MANTVASMMEIRQAMARRENFAAFVAERIAMQVEQRSSADHYLHTYHFPNIDRKWDATTQWLIFNYYAPNVNNHNLWMAPIIGRYFNKPATLNQLPVPEWLEAPMEYWKPKIRWLNEMGGHPLFYPFNNAVCQRFGGETTGYQFETLLRAMITNANRFEDTISSGLSAESVSKVIELLPGIGQFLSAEIMQDLLYTKLSAGYKDRDTWIMPSKAAKHGLSILFKRDPEMAVPDPIAKAEVHGLTDYLNKEVGVEITAWMTLRALGLYDQYYKLQTVGTAWKGLRLYVPGKTIDLTVPYPPEEE
jgi:hypothetical protein